MKHDKPITYTTGAFAAHFGIKKDTLFYYDKIGLFCPAGIKGNGYRYYTASQLEPFRTLLSLKELNVPLKILQEYFQDPSPEKLSAISAEQLLRVETEMEKLRRVKAHLTQITSALKEAEEADFGTAQIVKIPAKRFLYSRHIDSSLETTEQQWSEIQDEFLLTSGLKGTANVGSVIAKSDLENGNFDRVDCLFVESGDSAGTIRKGGKYALYYHKGAYSSVKFAYQRMLSQIAALGYTPAGDAYEEYLIAETATKQEDEYVTKILIKLKASARSHT